MKRVLLLVGAAIGRHPRAVSFGTLLLVAGALLLSDVASRRAGEPTPFLRATNALATMLARSPGERTSSHLTKLKLTKQHAAPRTRMARVELPRERALGKVFPSLAQRPFALPAQGLGDSPPLAISEPPLVIDNFPFPRPGIQPLGPFIPGGGSGGGPGGGGISPPAVPEPASWLLMITGFAIVGTAVRRGRRVARHAG